MRLKDIDLTQLTLLHDTNIKFLDGKMPEPINDIEMLHNIERQWLETQPNLWTLSFVASLGGLMLLMGIAFWIYIVSSFVLDYQSFVVQTAMEMLGVLFINSIILLLTGLCGWGGIYLLEFTITEYRDKDKHLKPEAVYHKLLTEGEFKVGQVLQFLNDEQTQLVFHVENERDVYVLLEQSKLEAGDFVLTLRWEQYTVLL